MEYDNLWGWRTRWSYSYTVLLLCWFGWISIYLCKSVMPPVLPILVDDLGLTHTQGGMFETAYLIGYMLIRIPAGIMANRFGIKRILIIGMIGYALFTMLNVFANTFMHVLVLRFLVGLFQGVHLPLANTLLSESFKSRQGKAIGFHESGPNIGSTVAFPIAVFIAMAWGWRWAFLLLSFPAFAISVAAFIFLKNDEKSVDSPGRRWTNSKSGLKLRSFQRVLIPLALAHAIYNLCMRALLYFTPSYLVEFRGMNLATAGFISMILPASGFFAKISSGFLAEKLGRRNTICAATTLSGAFTASLTVFKGEHSLSLVFLMVGLSLYSFSPTIYASVTAALPSQLKSVGLGVVTMVGSLTAAFSTSFVGLIIDAHGYSAALKAMSATVLVTTIIIYMMMKDESGGPKA